MRWTNSQKELIELSREPVNGFMVDIVEVHNYCSGLSRALDFIERQPFANMPRSAMPRNVRLDGSSAWNSVMELVNLTSKGNYGSGYLDTIWRCLPALSGNERRALCLWIEDSHLMRPVNRERLAVDVEHVAGRLQIGVRIIFLTGKVRLWDFKACKRFSAFVHSARMEERARKFQFTREGLDELRREAEPAASEPLRALA